VMRVSETAREVTDITHEGVTYSLVKKWPKSEGRVENCLDCNGRGRMYPQMQEVPRPRCSSSVSLKFHYHLPQ
jgi:hypothetical protein